MHFQWIFFLVGCVVLNSCAYVPYEFKLPFSQKDTIRRNIRLDVPEDYIKLGVAYENAGLYEKASKAYEVCVNGCKYKPTALINLGNILAKLAQYEAAENLYQTAIGIEPENIRALNNLAWLLITTGNKNKVQMGIDIGETCLSLARQRETAFLPYIHDTLAWGYFRQNKDKESIIHANYVSELLGSKLNEDPLLWGRYKKITRNQ